jgi:hypothetical protein
VHPEAPLGIRRDGDGLTVLVGYQCRPQTHLTRLLVERYDRSTDRSVPLWEIAADRPRAVRSITLGTVPDGYRATVDNLASQARGATLSVTVETGDPDGFENAVFDVEDVRDGRVLDANWDVVTEDAFLERYSCAGR